MEEKELSPEELQSFKQELADVKADLMRKELEEIKKERMRKELDEIKKERESDVVPARSAVRTRKPKLSISTLLFAALSLITAGYLIGTIYVINVAAVIDNLLISYGQPALGVVVVIVLAVILALLGAGMITIVKK